MLGALEGTLHKDVPMQSHLAVRKIACLLGLFCAASTASAQQAPLYWTIKDDALFSSSWRLNGADGTPIETLPGRSLIAMLEAERRIAAQFGLKPKILLTNPPGLNAFATEVNGETIVAVYTNMVLVIGDDVNVWAALFGHEFAHLYHHHVTTHETRAAVLNFLGAVVNAYDQSKGRDRSALVNFSVSMVDNTFTRDQEREADATGARFMIDAGFDPQGAVKLQQILIAKVGSYGALSFLTNHPSGEERIRNIERIIAASPPPAALAATEFSPQLFNQWLVLCSSDAKAADPNHPVTISSMQGCLLKHDPEFSKRYALCALDMNARKQQGSDDMRACAAESPRLHGFTYDIWAQYCISDSLAHGSAGLINAPPVQHCLWDGDFHMAFRGALCSSEVSSLRLPNDKGIARVRECALEPSDEAKRFSYENWKYACDRMAAFRAEGSDPSKIAEDCLVQGPVALQNASLTKGVASAQSILDAVVQARSALSPAVLSSPVTECDRLASLENLPGVKAVYHGFIEAPAAERACLEAIKGASDPSRYEVNLAGVYLQQGRFTEAFALATKAAKHGTLNADATLANQYSFGLGVARSADKAVPLLLADVKRGSVNAIDDLGDMVASGRDAEKSPEIAFKLYKIAADLGSAMAANDAALAYLSGTSGVPTDVAQATKMLRAASEEYPPALNGLSRALRATPGANADEIRGLLTRLFTEVGHYAELGSLSAQMRLGLLYTNGMGTPRDQEKGFALLMQAEERGYPAAAVWVAYGYLNGTGTAVNRDKAIEAFRKAAAAGSPEAAQQITRLASSAN
jgi:TPR repeat protein/Zn-dependent protease with chaperone function